MAKIEEAIVISRMYAGSYLYQSNKIGAEAINLFKADNGNNYIYVNPYGYVAPRYNDKVSVVVLTRLVRSGIFEVVGIAKIKDHIAKVNGISQEKNFEETATEIEKLDIKYNDFTLKDIHGNYAGTVTFEAERVYIPKKPIWLLDEQKHNIDTPKNVVICKLNKKFADQSLIMYIDCYEGQKNKDIETIKSLLLKDYWLDDDKFDWNIDLKTNTIDENDKNFNFLNIIKKENDENIFSNMLYYFFSKYHNLLNNFSKNVIIEREHKNIDLLISDEKNIVVIENKIKSGINGIIEKTEEEKAIDNKISSQLKKYFDYIEVEKVHLNRNRYYFIFIPEYNKTLNLKDFSKGNKYKKISYKKIYEFFSHQEIQDDKYYEEFVKALHKQSQEREKDFYEEIKSKLIKRIKKLKETKKD